jgi:hypothetical protein
MGWAIRAEIALTLVLLRFRNLEKDSARSMSFVFWVDNKRSF